MGEVLVFDRARLLESHEPLVGKYARAFLWCGAPYDELYHVGWIACVRAVEKYDPIKFQNGLTAYAIHWIRGALTKFAFKNKSLVRGRRTEHSKYPSHLGSVEYFGNVAVGNGEIARDVSLDVSLEWEADNFDDDDSGGFHVDLQVDRSLEAGRGDFFWERLTRHLNGRDRFIMDRRLAGDTLQEIGDELGISAERVRQIANSIEQPPISLRELDQYQWADHQACRFYLDCKAFCASGIGYLCRDRRTETKCRREILPYRPPASLVKITTYGSAAYYRQYNDKLRSYQRLERASYVSEEERNRHQDDWPEWKRYGVQRQNPSARKLKAREKIGAEQDQMFWSDDNLSQYEIASSPSYLRGVPFMVHDRTYQLSRQLDGEGKPRTTWAFVSHWHKRRVKEVGEELVQYRTRKRDIRQYLKPDSKLVLLFWARQIIAWHYTKYWMQPLKQAV